uniref:Ovule protein n=1 Tax=Steinernema glaseri TaxID=37863 RepID=A0A1I7Z4J6_9BILA
MPCLIQIQEVTKGFNEEKSKAGLIVYENLANLVLQIASTLCVFLCVPSLQCPSKLTTLTSILVFTMPEQ